jgi:hypothetical protein
MSNDSPQRAVELWNMLVEASGPPSSWAHVSAVQVAAECEIPAEELRAAFCIGIITAALDVARAADQARIRELEAALLNEAVR